MNKFCYRIIFNKCRQQLMAVAETVTGQGKSGSKATAVSTVPTSGYGVLVPNGKLFKAITVFTLMCHGAAVFAADIIAAPNAALGKQPGVIAAPNGVTVVNIAAPTSGGVSHNQYQQFNVGSGGAILNNSPTLTTTQLGGYINGNANLTPGNSARLILNEVIAPNPSQLSGMLEVAGQKAEVILANPWGITVAGGAGFINTNNATLTTGVPQLSNGILTGYRVAGGAININGQTDVSNLDSFTIISRALQVNAGLYAKQLNVVLGANQVDKTTLNAMPIQGSGAAPALALDVAQLGGMYAGAIKLIGTESGVGVNSRGQIQTTSGTLQLTSAGDLVLLGSTSSQGDMTLQTAGTLNNSGTTSSAGNLDAGANQALLNGTLAAASNLSVSANTLTGSGTVAAGAQADGTLSGSGALSLNASQTLTDNGRLLAAGSATLQGNGLTLDHATVSSLNGNLSLSSQGNLSTQSATVTAGSALAVNAAGTLNNQNGLLDGQSFSVNVGSLSNAGGKLLGLGSGTSQLTISQSADNSQGGQIGSNGNLTASVGSLNNAAGTLTAASQLNLTSAGQVSNQSGFIAGQGLSLSAASLNNQGGQVEQQGSGTAQVSVSGTLDNSQGGQLLSSDQLQVTAATLNNNGGTAQAAATFNVNAGSLSNQGGKLLGLGTTGSNQLNVAQSLDNSQHGQISTNANLTMTAASVNNNAGTLTSAGQLNLISAGQVQNQQGTIAANGLSLSAASLNNEGGKVEQPGSGAASVNMGNGTLDNSQGGVLLSNGQLTVTAGSVNNNGGTLGGQGDLSLTVSQSVTNAQGTIASHGALNESAALISNDQGVMQAGTTLSVSAQTFSNTGGTIQAVGNGTSTLTASQQLSNAGTVASNGSLNVTTTNLNNQGGTFNTGGNLLVTADQLPNVGTLQSGNDLTLNLQSDLNAASGSTILANHNLSINSTGNINNSGNLQAINNLTLQSQNLSNSGQIQAGGTLNTTETGTLSNSASGVIAAQTVNLTAPTQSNQGLITGQTLTLSGTDLSNDSSTGTIAATGNLSLQFGNSINNTNGALISADGDLAIGSAAQPVTTLNNNQSTIQAGGNASVYATTMTNQSNPVTVTQSSTSSSKTQTTTGLGSTCNGGGNVGGGGNHGEGNYLCTVPVTYVLGYTFTNGVMSDLATTYGITYNNKSGSGVSTTTSLTVYSIISNDPSTDTLELKVQTVNPGNNSQIDLTSAAWNDPNNPVWSQYSRYVSSTTLTVSYFAQQGNTYLALPNYNPNSNLINSSLQSGSTSNVMVLTPGQVAATASAFAVEGGYPSLPNSTISLAAGQVVVAGRDTVAQVNETTRTTDTTVTTDAASNAVTPANLLVGGSLLLSSQTLNNLHSNIEAGGNLTIQAGAQVNNVGQSLNQVTSIQTTSQFQGNIFTGSGPYTSQNTSTSTVQVGSVNAVISANQSLAITAPSINNNTINPANLPSSTSNTPTATAGNTVAGSHLNSSPAVVGNPVSNHFTLPTGGLFSTVSNPGQHYLIETNPQFTQYANFISSDYMLKQLGFDPNTVEKRLGDGYYEQQLVAQTVTSLTGQRFLSGDTSAEQEYQNLMSNGVQYAKQFGLTPGISLSDAQMAQLTSPMVWLVSQTVEGQQVLVPEVYLPGSTTTNTGKGAVMAGKTMTLAATGDLTNSGILSTQGGTLTASAQNININGGVVQSDSLVNLQASQDLSLNTNPNQQGRTAAVNAGSAMLQSGHDLNLNAANITTTGDATLTAGNNLNISNTQQTQTAQTTNWTNIGKVSQWNETKTSSAASSLSAGGNLALSANNNLNVIGSAAHASGNLTASAGNTLSVQSTIDTTSQQQVGRNSGFTQQTQTIDTAGLSAQGNLALAANQNVNLTAAQLQAGNTATIQSGQDVNANALATNNNSSRYQNYSGESQSSQTDISQTGSTIQASSGLGVAATRDINTQAAYITTQQGNLALTAGRDINLATAQASHSDYSQSVSSSDGFFSSTTSTNITSNHTTTQQGSTLSGNTIQLQSGRDTTITGSTVAGTQGVGLVAGNNLTIQAATNSQQQYSYQNTRTDGLFSGGGIGFTIGSQQTTDTLNASGTTQSQSRSMVGSVSGDLTLTAGQQAAIQGSDVTAGGNVNVQAQNLTIDPGKDTYQSQEEIKTQSSGLTVQLTSPAISALQAVYQASQNYKAASDTRTQALAASTAALAGYNTYAAYQQAMASTASSNSGSGLKVSITLGASSSDTKNQSSGTSLAGSLLKAGDNLTLNASGAGQNSNLTATAAQLVAGNNANLSADNAITLQAGQNTDSQQTSSKSVSAGAGVAIAVGSGGGSMGFTAYGSMSRSNSKSSDVEQTNTTVNAGNTLTLNSGGDTTLKGAVASANQVVANVGGNLNIQSLQDTSSYHSQSQSISAEGTVGFGGEASGSFSMSKMDNDYASVIQQSGIKAGNGGFQINVNGNTNLTGAVIESNQTAVDKGLNSLTTGSLTVSDIQNHADYSAQSVSLGLSSSMGGSGSNTGNLMSFQNGLSATPGFANASSSASSTTTSGISGGTLVVKDGSGSNVDRTVTTATDTTHTLSNSFNKDQLQNQLDTALAFEQQLGTAVQNVVQQKQTALENAKSNLQAAQANAQLSGIWGGQQTGQSVEDAQNAVVAAQADLANWQPGSTNRTILTALSVAAGGNVAGGVSGFVQDASIAYIQGLTAQQVKTLADATRQDPNQEDATSALVRATLQGIVACAGGAASTSGNCGSQALGASGAVALNTALNSLQGTNADTMTPEQKQQRQDLITSILGGLAAATGGNGAAASAGAQTELVNNSLLSASDQALLKKATANCGPSSLRWCDVKNALKAKEDQLVASTASANGVNPLTNTSNSEAGRASTGQSADIQSVTANIKNEPGLINTTQDIVTAAAGGVIFKSAEAGASALADAAEVSSANSTVTSGGVANAASAAGLKMDLQTTQAANEVVDSLRATGQLPSNYVTKAEAVQNGWMPGKALGNTNPGAQLGGDVFNNSPPIASLPQAAGRTWQEVDIGLSNTMSRSNQPGTRLLYSNDGLLYITTDHYNTVTSIGRWK